MKMRKRLLGTLIVLFFVGSAFASAFAYEALVGPTGVLKYNKAKAYNGWSTSGILSTLLGFMPYCWRTVISSGVEDRRVPPARSVEHLALSRRLTGTVMSSGNTR